MQNNVTVLFYINSIIYLKKNHRLTSILDKKKIYIYISKFATPHDIKITKKKKFGILYFKRFAVVCLFL